MPFCMMSDRPLNVGEMRLQKIGMCGRLNVIEGQALSSRGVKQSANALQCGMMAWAFGPRN